jgi:hypothetical protein
MHVAAFHHQLPKELVVVCASGHAAGHANHGELGLLRRPRNPDVVVSG